MTTVGPLAVVWPRAGLEARTSSHALEGSLHTMSRTAPCGVPSDVPRTGDVTCGPRWREGFGVYHRPPLKPVQPSAVEGVRPGCSDAHIGHVSIFDCDCHEKKGEKHSSCCGRSVWSHLVMRCVGQGNNCKERIAWRVYFTRNVLFYCHRPSTLAVWLWA